MKRKSEVLIYFHNLLLHIEKLFNTSICCLQSDSGGEYTSNWFQSYLSFSEISHCKSCPPTLSQNGFAETKIWYLIETVRTFLIDVHLPLKLWANTFLTPTYLNNRVLTSTLYVQKICGCSSCEWRRTSGLLFFLEVGLIQLGSIFFFIYQLIL